MNSNKKRITVLTGSGISQESGIPTFRGSNGLWQGHKVQEVGSPEGWFKNPALVLQFYNERRKVAFNAKPNLAHKILAELEEFYEVLIITQNIDNLHQRAGSTNVLHLHGEIFKARSTEEPDYVVEIEGTELNIGDLCPYGSQLRPHVVWFGEPVLSFAKAAEVTHFDTDVFVVVGTSLVVNPAAALISYVPDDKPKYVIDPVMPSIPSYNLNVHKIEEKATVGLEILKDILLKELIIKQ
jgi:NAD-dependent deacetylase